MIVVAADVRVCAAPLDVIHGIYVSRAAPCLCDRVIDPQNPHSLRPPTLSPLRFQSYLRCLLAVDQNGSCVYGKHIHHFKSSKHYIALLAGRDPDAHGRKVRAWMNIEDDLLRPPPLRPPPRKRRRRVADGAGPKSDSSSSSSSSSSNSESSMTSSHHSVPLDVDPGATPRATDEEGVDGGGGGGDDGGGEGDGADAGVEEAPRCGGSDRRDEGIPWGVCHFTPTFKHGVLNGYQLVCRHPTHKGRPVCQKTHSFGAAGGSEDFCLHRLKAWFVWGLVTANKDEHALVWADVMDAGLDLTREAELDRQVVDDWPATLLAYGLELE